MEDLHADIALKKGQTTGLEAFCLDCVRQIQGDTALTTNGRNRAGLYMLSEQGRFLQTRLSLLMKLTSLAPAQAVDNTY